MNLALFDFDGTITRKDSFASFLRFLKGDLAFAWYLFLSAPHLLGWKLSMVSAKRAKERLFQFYFKDVSILEMQKCCEDYLPHLEKLVNPMAAERLKWHQDRGDRVVIVSASCEEWLELWCEKMDVELIATKLERSAKENVYTGKISGANCNGQEKVNRIRQLLKPDQYKQVFAYGNSKGDLPMLELATEKHYRYF